jgi:hypothetical protein
MIIFKHTTLVLSNAVESLDGYENISVLMLFCGVSSWSKKL